MGIIKALKLGFDYFKYDDDGNASEPQRAVKGMIFAMMTSFGMGVLMFWLAYWHGDLLVSLFVSGKPEVVLGGADYLRAYAVDCLLTAFMFCFHGFFIGVGRRRLLGL